MHQRDLAWAGSLLDHVPASWRRQAVTPNGLFYPYLDRQWRRREDGPRTLVSQCRLSYNFVRAFERSGDQEYADVARHGLDALIRYFRDAEGNGYAWACHADGSVQDDTYDAYGHAFVILALATAAQVFHDSRYRDLALETWAFMQRRFRDDHGGLIWHIDRNGRIASAVSTSGWAWKYPGRLGDSPIIGAGNFADDRWGAAACTGRGEMAQRACTAHSVVTFLRFGMALDDALTLAIEDLSRLNDPYASEVNIVAIDRHGEPGAVSTEAGKTFVLMTEEMARPEVRERRQVPRSARID
jgi:rhamnogalacturonyl hydrolase YesR